LHNKQVNTFDMACYYMYYNYFNDKQYCFVVLSGNE